MSSGKRKHAYLDKEWFSPTKSIHHEKSPVKRMRRCKPRRSLGLVSKSDWQHCQDGFDGIDVSQRKSSSSKKIPNSKLTKNIINGESLSQVDIDNFSSDTEDDTLADITPLDPNGFPGNSCSIQFPGLAQNLEMSSKKKIVRKESHVRKNKTRTVITRDVEEGTSIDMESPVHRKHCSHDPRSLGYSSNHSHIHEFSDVCMEQAAGPDIHERSTQSPSISSVSTSLSPDQNFNPAPSKQRGSDWLRNVQWQVVSPQRPNTMEDETTSWEDSSKKKKQKFIRGGLAEKLQRLISREKSDVAIWAHKMATNPTLEVDSTRHMTVVIRNMRTDSLMVIANCSNIDNNKTTDDVLSISDGLTVLFNRQTIQHLGITEGSTIQVHAPWQTLRLSCGSKVILCTHFCRLLSPRPDSHSSHKFNNTAAHSAACLKSTASWSCPCVKGKAYQSCPAQVFPCNTAPLIDRPSNTTGLGHTPGHETGEDKTRVDTDGALHTVWQAQPLSQVSSSILDSIEQKDGFSSTGISFKATVQRVFCQQLKNTSNLREKAVKPWKGRSGQNNLQYSLMLQDDQGSICEAMLPPGAEQTEGWCQLVAGGEGKIWAFTGMRQHQRTKRSRSPALFQLIDTVWSPQSVLITTSSSQEESQKSQDLEACLQPPGFCYKFMATTGISTCLDLQAVSTKYQPPLFYTLKELNSIPENVKRASVVCKLIYCLPEHTELVEHPQYWYVTDASIQTAPSGGHHKNCVRIYASSSCYLSEDVNQVIKNGQAVLLVKDLNISTGTWTLDGYSCVSLVTETSLLDNKYRGHEHIQSVLENLKPSFPSLLESVDNIKEGEIVSVKGTVCGVNEGMAYSWLVCDKCGSDKLNSDSDVLQCQSCQNGVQNPATKMTLEVYTDCGLHPMGIEGSVPKVKVKLRQETIEHLLPHEEPSEGYELDSILNCQLGPLLCRVVDIYRSQGNDLKRLHLEEIFIPK